MQTMQSTFYDLTSDKKKILLNPNFIHNRTLAKSNFRYESPANNALAKTEIHGGYKLSHTEAPIRANRRFNLISSKDHERAELQEIRGHF
ncbi:hypothetical protein CEXT_686711 [Caerostris extrusa]|uniref:Uncharacterized protein n=1 Tax=Caerostris extrusa TaxID=172846 RepID=A0AAV4QV04_CAEEX|nr:hypothetical protein CEXT_686711 [Caerostris extrusa]